MGRRAAATHGLGAGRQAKGLTLDAGALIALERADPKLTALLDRVTGLGRPVAVPAAALAQAWRASPRQHRLAVLLADDEVEVPALDLEAALAVGALLAATGTSDVIDAAVVLAASQRGHWIVTSDSADLRQLDPSLPTIDV